MTATSSNTTFNKKEKGWFAGAFEHGQLGHAVTERELFETKRICEIHVYQYIRSLNFENDVGSEETKGFTYRL